MRWRNVGCVESVDMGWLVNPHAQDVPCELLLAAANGGADWYSVSG